MHRLDRKYIFSTTILTIQRNYIQDIRRKILPLDHESQKQFHRYGLQVQQATYPIQKYIKIMALIITLYLLGIYSQ